MEMEVVKLHTGYKMKEIFYTVWTYGTHSIGD